MFLLVYVHSRMHDDTETFVRDMFCKQDLKDFVDENFACYLGSINKPEAFAFVQTLGITGALLTCIVTACHCTTPQHACAAASVANAFRFLAASVSLAGRCSSSDIVRAC
jgi:hypothetical protein